MTAEEWVVNYCKAYGLDWKAMSAAGKFKVTMLVPCTIRCFRVGGPVEVALGEDCPECGKTHEPPKTRYDHMNENGAL